MYVWEMARRGTLNGTWAVALQEVYIPESSQKGVKLG